MSKYKVYKTTNLLTGEVYIGATSKNDESYYGTGPAIKKAIKVLGAEHFSREILSTHDTPEEAYAEETRLTTELLSGSTPSYNRRISRSDGGIIHSGGKATVKDIQGNTFQIDKNDPRIASGELISIVSGTTVVVDKDGNIFRTEVDDIRLRTGEFKMYNSNRIVVKDTRGRRFTIDKDDERIRTGELIPVGINTRFKKGDKISPETQFLPGDKWMYNPESLEHRCVRKDNIQTMLNSGWIFGRGTVKKKWITHPISNETKRLPLDEVEVHIAKGWVIGRKIGK